MLHVETKINDSFRRKLDTNKIKKAMTESFTREGSELAKAIQTEIHDEGHWITGTMARTTTSQVLQDSNNIEILIRNGTNYWQYVDLGTSKITAAHFVDKAVKEEEPAQKIAQHFKQLYNPNE